MSMIEVSYADGEVALTGTLHVPDSTPRAAVVVFPTIMNPTQSVSDKAADLAANGYLALVADFYGAVPASFDEARDMAMGIRATPETYRRRLRASLKALATRPEAAGLPIGAIGFCMGGQAVLELARDGAPLFAVVSFHGLLDTDAPAGSDAISARILVCHGDADPMVPRSQVMAFWEEMDAAGADWHFHSYAGVKHGFTNPAPNPNPATGYNASADRQSWAAMYALFDEVLGA
ncbi:prolyl oligopeptidase family serine peptidase [Altererythrobacter buctensis]|uniref:Prolyl oligopeptidase family serine peptidase n=2 Tax=Alteraurantiacibacter buctensis TaxID=1503981 RepID=A0A844Z2U7_9SPHN|nr:dienelactone hydrolase family protein [Alteraurantiacibacter buctensis]MXO72213.1 prolyl oligopeptidase family serine peptidase [Alteraurantiacibacter buctensis]